MTTGRIALMTAMVAGAVSSLVWAVIRTRSRRTLFIDDLSARLAANPSRLVGLVAHRGFHYPTDDLRRPVENTLAAYERAWSAGIRFCECDVSLTKDGEIVLCHDANLKRLALRPEHPTALKDISTCTFRSELECFPLKDGSRVPTLSEVLQAARRCGGEKDSQLVIEIKGEDEPCATEVSNLVNNDALLRKHIAIVMGFSLASVKKFAELNKNTAVLSMLLTVTRSGGRNIHLDIDANSAELVELIKRNKIDGLYVQYDPKFLRDDNANFANLCRQVPVGVWGRFLMDPDDRTTAEKLMGKGAKFVNSDFPDDFFDR